MALMTEVYEGNTAYLTASFLDADGNAAAPDTVTWQCHDLASGEQLKAATSVTPGTSVTITIPPSVNVLVDSTSKTEVHRVTVIGSYGGDDQVVAIYDFVVVAV